MFVDDQSPKLNIQKLIRKSQRDEITGIIKGLPVKKMKPLKRFDIKEMKSERKFRSASKNRNTEFAMPKIPFISPFDTNELFSRDSEIQCQMSSDNRYNSNSQPHHSFKKLITHEALDQERNAVHVSEFSTNSHRFLKSIHLPYGKKTSINNKYSTKAKQIEGNCKSSRKQDGEFGEENFEENKPILRVCKSTGKFFTYKQKAILEDCQPSRSTSKVQLKKRPNMRIILKNLPKKYAGNGFSRINQEEIQRKAAQKSIQLFQAHLHSELKKRNQSPHKDKDKSPSKQHQKNSCFCSEAAHSSCVVYPRSHRAPLTSAQEHNSSKEIPYALFPISETTQHDYNRFRIHKNSHHTKSQSVLPIHSNTNSKTHIFNNIKECRNTDTIHKQNHYFYNESQTHREINSSSNNDYNQEDEELEEESERFTNINTQRERRSTGSFVEVSNSAADVSKARALAVEKIAITQHQMRNMRKAIRKGFTLKKYMPLENIINLSHTAEFPKVKTHTNTQHSPLKHNAHMTHTAYNTHHTIIQHTSSDKSPAPPPGPQPGSARTARVKNMKMLMKEKEEELLAKRSHRQCKSQTITKTSPRRNSFLKSSKPLSESQTRSIIQKMVSKYNTVKPESDQSQEKLNLANSELRKHGFISTQHVQSPASSQPLQSAVGAGGTVCVKGSAEEEEEKWRMELKRFREMKELKELKAFERRYRSVKRNLLKSLNLKKQSESVKDNNIQIKQRDVLYEKVMKKRIQKYEQVYKIISKSFSSATKNDFLSFAEKNAMKLNVDKIEHQLAQQCQNDNFKDLDVKVYTRTKSFQKVGCLNTGNGDHNSKCNSNRTNSVSENCNNDQVRSSKRLSEYQDSVSSFFPNNTNYKHDQDSIQDSSPNQNQNEQSADTLLQTMA
jgi:hypothetical protein